MHTAKPPASLLWPPPGKPRVRSQRLHDEAVADLELGSVVAALVGADAPPGRRSTREAYAMAVLRELVCEPEVIAHRVAVLTDLIEQTTLREHLVELLPSLEQLAQAPVGERYRPTAEPSLERVARRLADLELLVDVVVRLDALLASADATSAGLQNLTTAIGDLRHSPTFESLERELPELRATLSTVRSVTVAINLGPDLLPSSATILGFSGEPVEGRRSLLWRLMGDSAETRGISPLQRGEGGPRSQSNELLRDLRQMLARIVEPVRSALDEYERVNASAFGELGAELAFVLGAANLVLRLRDQGLPMCAPELLPVRDRQAELTDAYDVRLALASASAGADGASTVVTNQIAFDHARGRVWVLTGPNHGGKTTYTRAVGVAQTLFQAGLYVPATSARLSPVDAIYTHFPAREDARLGQGRLDAEAERLAAIFRGASRHSLILLNEALAGTSALEALDLARGVVRALRLLGARAIYVTHLHELAAVVDDINATTPGDGTVASLVAEPGEPSDGLHLRPYRIQPGPPRGISYAAQIAEQHGISYEQLAKLLQER
jgi:DNA mismatch repair protein MutS